MKDNVIRSDFILLKTSLCERVNYRIGVFISVAKISIYLYRYITFSLTYELYIHQRKKPVIVGGWMKLSGEALRL